MSDFTHIDQNALDQEWLRQPNLMYDFAMSVADAKRDVDAFKNELEVIKAEISNSVRSAPEQYGLAKVTESAIASAVLQTKEYQDAMQQAVELRHKYDVMVAAVNALEHKKRALESLVSLHGQNYFSTPRVDAESKEAFEEQSKRSVRRSSRRRRKTT